MFAVVSVIAGCVCDVFPLSKARFRSSVYTFPDDGKILSGPTYKKDAAASLPVFRLARSLLVMLEIRGYTARDLIVDNEILDFGRFLGKLPAT
jgi:hypothetical protein